LVTSSGRSSGMGWIGLVAVATLVGGCVAFDGLNASKESYVGLGPNVGGDDGGTVSVPKCVPETPEELCAAKKYACGELLDYNKCGDLKKYNCGASCANDPCTASTSDQQCCAPTADGKGRECKTIAGNCASRSCSSLALECGAAVDNCGLAIDCGQCSGGRVCANNRCTVPVCVLDSTQTGRSDGCTLAP
jgi:hypothetical protein